MNISKVLIKEYENIANCKLGENKPNTKPNKANLPDDQMNVNKVLTKDYENTSNLPLFENKPNTNPIKPNFSLFIFGYQLKSRFWTFKLV